MPNFYFLEKWPNLNKLAQQAEKYIQNQFVDFVNQVEKLKFEIESSLKKLENNLNSLMQKAFNGEL